jgi:hypothetical protein
MDFESLQGVNKAQENGYKRELPRLHAEIEE